MIEWERCGAAWGRAVAIKCDGCGTRKPMLTADALPCAWVVRNEHKRIRLRPERTAEIRALAREYDVTASAVVDTAMAVALRSGDLVAVLSLAALASGGRE